jgi:adenosine deaminase
MADPRPEQLPIEFFQSLPKADLHVHLDGSLRMATIVDLAREENVELPSFERAEPGASCSAKTAARSPVPKASTSP